MVKQLATHAQLPVNIFMMVPAAAMWRLCKLWVLLLTLQHQQLGTQQIIFSEH
jgi:hypothetical protein